jgi:hypothetical protein
MKSLLSLLTTALFITSVAAQAPPKSFELNNPDAIQLTGDKLKLLTKGYWRVFQDDTEIKGQMISRNVNTSICYYPDGKFFYNGATGTWQVLEGKYIEHTMDDKAKEGRLNFGGIFCATELSESGVTLTKILTTSHDMLRMVHLKPSTVLTPNEQANSGIPYFYDGKVSEAVIDSIKRMNPEELFNVGLTKIGNSMVHIMTPDSLYIIRFAGN